MLQKLANAIFKPRFKKFENKIGWKLEFKNIPERFVNGVVEWDLTETFKKFGLNILEGADYWTLGKIADGVSTRFDPTSPQYQSWLGGYVVKLPNNQDWTVEDHFKLAIADQNSWLHTYGDPNPATNIAGCEFKEIGPINCTSHTGVLYEGGCITHSDVGQGKKPAKFRIETDIMADLFNLSNPELKITGSMLRPKESMNSYETLKLEGYIAIFNLEENVKVVLYGNGVAGERKNTFEIIKEDILKAFKNCSIVRVE